MGNVAANIGKRLQCAVDIRSLQPWSAGVSGIPYMVGVAEELLRLATYTTEFDIKAVIADRATYCVNMCRRIYVAPRMSSPWVASTTQVRHSNVFQHTGFGSEIR